MKGIDVLCASQAATAICLSMDQASSSSSSVTLGSGPAIDRYNPIITDSRRTATQLPPCTNTSHQPPITPKPQRNHHKKKNKKTTLKENSGQAKKSDVDGEKTTKVSSQTSAVGRKSWGCTKPGDFISPHGSTRYLLSDKVVINGISDMDPALKLFPDEISKCKAPAEKTNESSASPDQVVVLRVSLHCRGCERKMRKHISRMEGVTSFNIDFAAKKVTVTGNVTPLEVLSSISKVKNAQLWSPTVPSSTTPVVNMSHDYSGFKNEYKGAGA
ncbi:protein SODIUM POTASSIUM ROOT DEFECTIVE 2 [Sesamum indicum]|uniref:Protein SODIUM POTASSIUM ROOT DEFECTIVE 2 n=1 Tax=Sesamum indicum TaxID=4182 RepID=A0A6I9U353_SESIN|nr:protein SODIUM POTASSIUM ROOT DEFECTIVE 2 [Sesamum indicum]